MKSIYLDAAKLQRFIDSAYSGHLRKFQLTPIEAHVLIALNETGAMMASELARCVGRAAVSFTPILDRLQECGYLERQSHPTDRRAVVITLTDAGRKLLPALNDALISAHDEVCTSFFKVGHPARQFVEQYLMTGKPY